MARRRGESDDQSSAVLSNRGFVGSYANLNKLVVWWTTVMILTVLTILSYFTMALITEAQREMVDNDSRLLEDADQEEEGDDANAGDDANDDVNQGADDDDMVDDAANDEYNDAGDDANQDGDGNEGDDEWDQDNYDHDDDENYDVDDAISNDDGFEDSFGFSFSLSGPEIFFLLFLLVSVIALDYYGLEALKELGNKAARFRIGAFAAFVLMLANISFVVAILLGLSKSPDSIGGGLAGMNANAVAVFFLIMTIIYLFFGIALYKSERSSLVSSDRREPLIEDSKRETSNNLFKFWMCIVVLSGILMIVSYAFSKSVNVAHQSHWKFHFSLILGALVVAIFAIIGWISLRARGLSTKLLTGTFFGGLVGMGCLFFIYFIYFAPFVYGVGKEEGVVTAGETAFSFISLSLSITYGAFGHAVYTYRHSIIKANAADSGLPTALPLMT